METQENINGEYQWGEYSDFPLAVIGDGYAAAVLLIHLAKHGFDLNQVVVIEAKLLQGLKLAESVRQRCQAIAFEPELP